MRTLLLALVAALALAGCATAPAPTEEPAPVTMAQPAPAPVRGDVLASDARFVVVTARPGDDYAALATRHLGDARKAWWIADMNGDDPPRAGDAIVIPRTAPNPLGVSREGVQTVTILCYHRFGSPKRKLVVTRPDFEAQMDYLARNGYTVVTLAQVAAFLDGREALPPKSVAITIDDGYRSTFDVAYPVLRKHRFPATVFLYTDFVGAGDAMTWPQMQEMRASGLIDIQPHSKTHGNLSLRLPGETSAQYRDRVRLEVERPVALIGERLGGKSLTFAFPYGDVNEAVVAELQRNGVRLGVTVTPGGNPFYAYPYMLRRSMVFGTDDLETFKARLATTTRLSSR